MKNIISDIRYGLRTLSKKPGFSATVVLVLALCVAANTTIFSVVNAILLRPLGFAHADQLVRVWAADLAHGFPESELSPPDIHDIHEQTKTLEGPAAFYARRATLTGVNDPLRLKSVLVTAQFFPVLGVQPMLGRFFSPDEEKEGNDHVAVLSHSFWQQRFNGNPNAIGQTLTLDGVNYTVIGVLPRDFKYAIADFGDEPEIWQPLTLDLDPQARASHLFDAIAKLKPGVTLQQAQAEMNNIAKRLEEQYPDSNQGYGITLEPLQESLVGDTRLSLLLLLVAGLFVLLIACANVANLLLARAMARQKEFNLRAALGATRRRIIQQLLTENALLGVTGGILGLLLSVVGLKLLLAISPADVPRLNEVSLDAPVLAFNLFITLLTTLVVGLAPALLVSRTNLNEALKQGGRVVAGTHARFQKTLVVSEIALALVLLIGAGLMVKSFWRLLQVDPGFAIKNVLTMKVFAPNTHYRETAQVGTFYQQLFERTQTIPGVQAVGAIDILPLSGDQVCQDFTIDGRPVATGADACVETRVVSPAYFNAMSIVLQRGALYSGREDSKTPPVVIINQAMARRFWPGEDSLGKHLTIYGVSREIIGLVANVKHFGQDVEAAPELYLPLQQKPRREMTLVLRTDNNPSAVASAVRGALRDVDKDVPVYQVKTMEDALAGSLAKRRFSMVLLIIFAVMAMILTAVGIYGVISYSVSLRTQEMGLRLALGAQTSDILRLIIGQGAMLCAIGVGIGVIAAFFLTRLIGSLLYGVGAGDPLTYVIITLILAGISILASYIPARRAANVQAVVALRNE
jgi:putative ABC transport system permease protein